MAITNYSTDADLVADDDVFDSGADFVSIPGWYLFRVKAIDEAPTDKNDELIDGIRLKCEVVTSTTKTKAETMFSEVFRAPDMAHRDGGKFMFRRMVRLAMGLDMKNCETQKPVRQIKKGEGFAVDWSEGEGRYFVALIKGRTWKTERGEGTNYEIDGLKIFHPSDKEVKEAGLKIPALSQPKAESKADETEDVTDFI